MRGAGPRWPEGRLLSRAHEETETNGLSKNGNSRLAKVEGLRPAVAAVGLPGFPAPSTLDSYSVKLSRQRGESPREDEGKDASSSSTE